MATAIDAEATGIAPLLESTPDPAMATARVDVAGLQALTLRLLEQPREQRVSDRAVASEAIVPAPPLGIVRSSALAAPASTRSRRSA